MMHRPGSRPANNTATMKRIQREIRDIEKEDMGAITLKPTESNIFNWTATIPGPEGSVYEGGVYKLSIQLPSDYPFSSPRVVFDTQIYHMNIAPSGAICIDVLKGQWSPALSLFKVLLSISSLLTDPNPQDPLVPAIAQEYIRNRPQHDRTAREWVRLYARPAEPPAVQVQDKGKARLQAPTPAPSGSNPNSARGTPLAVPQAASGSGNARREVINVSSDTEELTGRGDADEPIEIDDDDEPQPTRAKARRGRGRGRGSAASGGPSPVAGTKRREPDDGNEPGGSSSRGAGSSRTTRSSKRRAMDDGETIILD